MIRSGADIRSMRLRRQVPGCGEWLVASDYHRIAQQCAGNRESLRLEKVKLLIYGELTWILIIGVCD
jgi:hypothetical protein